MAQINIKVDDQLKDDVSAIFNEMGLDITTGIKIYLKRVQRDKRIPFEMTSNQFDVQKLAQRYQAGDQEVIANLNELFNALNSQRKQSTGIGGAILNNKRQGGTGIGGTILNKR